MLPFLLYTCDLPRKIFQQFLANQSVLGQASRPNETFQVEKAPSRLASNIIRPPREVTLTNADVEGQISGKKDLVPLTLEFLRNKEKRSLLQPATETKLSKAINTLRPGERTSSIGVRDGNFLINRTSETKRTAKNRWKALSHTVKAERAFRKVLASRDSRAEPSKEGCSTPHEPSSSLSTGYSSNQIIPSSPARQNPKGNWRRLSERWKVVRAFQDNLVLQRAIRNVDEALGEVGAKIEAGIETASTGFEKLSEWLDRIAEFYRRVGLDEIIEVYEVLTARREVTAVALSGELLQLN